MNQLGGPFTDAPINPKSIAEAAKKAAKGMAKKKPTKSAGVPWWVLALIVVIAAK